MPPDPSVSPGNTCISSSPASAGSRRGPIRIKDKGKARLDGFASGAAKRRLPFGCNPAFCHDTQYAPDELEFLRAVDAYQARTGNPFPTRRELFLILTKELGYARPEPPSESRP